MADGETARHALYRRLEEVLGADVVGTLMASLPPDDWSTLATKADLAASELATRQDIAQLREATARDIAEFREATTRDIADLREATTRDIADLREAGRHDLSDAVLRLERAMAEQSGSFERALRTELSKQSRAAVAGMVGMTATVGAFVIALLSIIR